ncbi:MAG: hypothetical protein V4612_01130 [Pseudomonadota bacterium]
MNKPMPEKNLNPNLENEIIIGFHLIRKSANSLLDDLKYFNQIPKYFSAQQIANILGQIEEVERNIKNVREIFNKRVLG